MSARIQVTMEDEQARKALANQKKAWEDNEDAVKKLGSQVGKAEKRQIRAAENIIKKQRTRKQVLEDNIKSLRLHGQASEDGAKRSNDAIRKLIASYREEEAAIESAEFAATEAGRNAAAAYEKQQSQIKKGVIETNRLKEATKTLDDRYDDLKASMRAAFEAGEISADDLNLAMAQLDKEQKAVKKSSPFSQSVGNVAKYAAGVLSVSAAIAAVKKAFQDYRAEVEKGVGETGRLNAARTSLVQVSDESNFKSRVDRSDDAAIRFGVDREKSSAALFDSISNGVEKDFETILGADRIIPAEVGSKFVGEFRKVFEKEGLTALESLNLGLAAAGTSKFNVQEILPQIRTAAQGSAALPGVESSDVAAFVSVLGSKFGDRTGTAVRGLQANFGAQLIKEQEALKTAKPEDQKAIEKNITLLSGSLSSITEGLNTKEFASLRSDIIKENKELLTTFKVAADSIGAIKKVDTTIETEKDKAGTDNSLLSKKNRAFFSDPVLLADFDKTRTEVRRQVTSERSLSELGNSQLAEQNRLNSELNEAGSNFLTRFLANTGVAVKQAAETAGVITREEREISAPRIPESKQSDKSDFAKFSESLPDGSFSGPKPQAAPTEIERKSVSLLEASVMQAKAQTAAIEKLANKPAQVAEAIE